MFVVVHIYLCELEKISIPSHKIVGYGLNDSKAENAQFETCSRPADHVTFTKTALIISVFIQ